MATAVQVAPESEDLTTALFTPQAYTTLVDGAEIPRRFWDVQLSVVPQVVPPDFLVKEPPPSVEMAITPELPAAYK